MQRRPHSSAWRSASTALAALFSFVQPAAAMDLVARSGGLAVEQVHKRSGLQFSANHGFQRMGYIQYRVHHHGRVVSVPDGQGGRRTDFRDAWTLGGTPRPAVLVHDNQWVLISEQEGQVRTEALPSLEASGLQWVDGPRAPLQVGRVHTAPRAAADLTLAGGRWLLLDDRLLLDLQTLRTHALAVQVPTGYVALADGALGMSPDGRAIALLYRGESNSARDALIIVASTEGPQQQLLPIDLKAYTGQPEAWADPSLLARHFRWERAAGTGLPALRPLPPPSKHAWQTRYRLGLGAARGPGGQRLSRFELAPVKSSMLEAAHAVLTSRCGCDFMRVAGRDGKPALQLKIPTVTATMRFDAAGAALVIESDDTEGSLWSQQITRDLGELIEERLVAGELQPHVVTRR